MHKRAVYRTSRQKLKPINRNPNARFRKNRIFKARHARQGNSLRFDNKRPGPQHDRSRRCRWLR